MSSVFLFFLAIAGLILFVQFLTRPRGGSYHREEPLPPDAERSDAHAGHAGERRAGHRHGGC